MYRRRCAAAAARGARLTALASPRRLYLSYAAAAPHSERHGGTVLHQQPDAPSTSGEGLHLKYPPSHSAQAVEGMGPTGFAGPLGGTQGLPFRVLRTKHGQLPVYTDYRNGRTRKLTILRKFSGDRKELREELWRALGGPTNPHLVIAERAGSLEIKGDYSAEVKMWLKRLGF